MQKQSVPRKEALALTAEYLSLLDKGQLDEALAFVRARQHLVVEENGNPIVNLFAIVNAARHTCGLPYVTKQGITYPEDIPIDETEGDL